MRIRLPLNSSFLRSDQYFISKTVLFHRLSLICILASEDIKQNVCNDITELRSCVKVEVAVMSSPFLTVLMVSLFTSLTPYR